MKHIKATVKEKLEYLRMQLQLECISYDELYDLQTLVPHIEADDVELLEAAGVTEKEYLKLLNKFKVKNGEAHRSHFWIKTRTRNGLQVTSYQSKRFTALTFTVRTLSQWSN